MDAIVYDKVGKEAEKVREALYGIYPQATITDAAIASFDDGADSMPVKKLEVAIEPVQDGSGDPSPDNVRPISGWTGAAIVNTGVNIWDEEWESGSYLDDGTPIPYNTRIRCKSRIIVKPNTSYYINASQNNYELYVLCYDVNSNLVVKRLVRNAVFFVPSQTCYILFFVANLATYNNDISINYPATDTEYHAHTGSQISVTFPTSAGDSGTVYGGTLTINPDRTGTLVVDRANALLLQSGNWVKYVSVNFCYQIYVGNNKFANDNVVRLASDKYVGRSGYAPTLDQLETINNGIYSVDGSRIRVYDKRFSTLEDFISSIGEGIQVVYELATPITYTLTTSEISGILSTLYGVNNVWADAGNIEELTYRADLGKYIDSHITTAVANALNA